MRVMRNEDEHWQVVVADFNNNPQHGIRGKGMSRKSIYVEQDAALTAIFESRDQREPINFLRAIAYRMPDAI